jgi:outer membrane protein assembly factor BamB
MTGNSHCKRAVWLALIAGLAGTAPALAAVNWMQSYHDGGHTGYNPSETTLSMANVSGLQLSWGQSVDCGMTAFALSNGIIYALGQGDCNGNWDLAAIDATTGAKKWTVPTGSGGNFPVVAAAGNLVFSVCGFVNDTSHSVGGICAYRKSTGKQVWRWSNQCHCLPESGVQSGPAYSNGVLYFGYANGGAGGAEYVVAADAVTGNTVWTHGTGSSNTLGTATIAVRNHAVYFSCAGANNFHGLCSIAQSDGTSNWAVDIGTGVGAITATADTVYVNLAFGSSSLVALEASTGATKWSFGAGQVGNQRPAAVAGKDVYYVDDDHILYDLRTWNGKARWSLAANAASAPSVANGILYVDGSTHWPAVSAYNAFTGAPLWSSPGVQGGLFPPPIVADGILYDSNEENCGNVCAYALPAGIVHR